MKKRLIALILCTVMVLSIAACSAKPADTQTGDPSGTDSQTDAVEVVTLPENMNYDGASFCVLTAGNVAYNDFDYDEDSAGVNVVSEAQYRRLALMEAQYGVKVESERKQNNSSYGNGPGYQAIALAVSSETDSYHLGIIGGYDVAALARNNYLYDLNSLKWVDTSKSWWDQNANFKDLLKYWNEQK